MANTGVKGRVIYSGSNDGVEGLEVIAVDYDPIYSEDILGSDTTKGDGSFEIKYTSDKYRDWYERNPDIVVRIYGPSSRLIYETSENENADVKVDTLTLDPIAIHENNVGNKERGEPWLVTYATLNPKDGLPVWCTQGNQIEHLTDGASVFPELTEAIEGAQQSVHLMNWKFDVKGSPISKFNEDDPKWYLNPKEGQKVEGQKIQEILIKKADEEGVKVNVVVWNFNVEAVTSILAGSGVLGLLLSGSIIGSGLLLLLSMPVWFLAYFGRGSGDTAADVEDYFKRSKVETAGFQSLWSLMHARAVIIDGKEAFVMGSSIDRKSFNDNRHLIHDARHGGTLWHDVSLKLYGPAVEYLDRTVATVWNAANPWGSSLSGGTFPVKNKMIPTTGPFPVKKSENLAGVQVIRTLPGNTYDGSHTHVEGRAPSVPKVPPGKEGEGIPYGETGPLEAYQRAIACAEDFIYIEDQYLTSPDIVKALIQRMTDNVEQARQLQLIIVLNIKPDHPDYRAIQKNCLLQLKAKIDNDRLGIFTLWSCREVTPKEASRYEIKPIYVHSKVGIVDDKWASMGTANLDGASMNQIQTVTTVDTTSGWLSFLNDQKLWVQILIQPILPLLSWLIKLIAGIGDIFVFRRPTQHANPNRSTQPSRFTDLRLVIYNNVGGQPETDAVVRLRNQLWREHLGYLLDSPHKDDYPATRPAEGWVKHWKDRAKEKCKAVKKKEKHPALILEWQPEEDPKKYLNALGIKTKDYFIRKKADSFDIDKGTWNKKE